MDDAINAIRTFNRFFTRHVGAIDARFLDTDASLLEARLLFEIARHEPVSAIALQAELNLDRGYLSRMIVRLEKRGWVRRDRLEADARTRPISLTQGGREVFYELDHRQRAAVAHDLKRLSAVEQDELVQALTKARLFLDRKAPAATLSTTPSINVLDRPVWNALTGRQAHIVQGDETGLRFAPEYGPFAAPLDPTGDTSVLADLAGNSEIWLVEKHRIVPPVGLKLARSAECVQMVARTITDGGRDHAFCDLGDDDAAEMFALATMTQPGPFSTRTHDLGRFVGIRIDGILVAMAGERMKPGIFTELSGVCTHPDHRGRGYAGFLMRVVASRMIERGEVPFLHCYATNTGAIALYQSLGFEIHQTITATVLMPA
ncbi:GNAT family N-acetyltransferase [Sphingobium sp.]|uniref:GNAT family N-acetyltransferase n=1 Tax=Sphingobium sp. TaxID=1912891 RepID=UPI003BB809A7